MRTGGAATLFDRDSCSAKSASFEYESGSKGYSWYNSDNMTDRGVGFWANSIMVPSGYVVELHSADSLKGDMQKIIGNSDQYGEMDCQKVNLYVYSLKIRPMHQGNAVGKWVQTASNNEGIGYSYLVGTTSSTSTEQESWMTSVLNHSMDLGIEFEGMFTSSHAVSH